jgi:hypothetical protein
MHVEFGVDGHGVCVFIYDENIFYPSSFYWSLNSHNILFASNLSKIIFLYTLFCIHFAKD